MQYILQDSEKALKETFTSLTDNQVFAFCRKAYEENMSQT